MYQRSETPVWLAALTAAVFIRMLSGHPVEAAARNVLQSPELMPLVVSLGSGERMDAPVEANQVFVLHCAPKPAPPPQAEKTEADKLTFGEADAAGLKIGGVAMQPADVVALLLAESPLDFSGEGAKVLIVHTHSSEAYTPEAGFFYTESEPLRTQDTARSVIRVGQEVAAVLESHGIKTIHDIEINDYPSYSGSYARMLNKIERLRLEQPSIQMVLDIHRDAISDEDGTPVGPTVTVDGAQSAQIMLVMGTDEGGLFHPNWRENLSWALKLQAVLNRRAPGLCRPLDLRTERFNQHVTRGSMLVEVGAGGNTLAEAILAGRTFAEGLAALIEGT